MTKHHKHRNNRKFSIGFIILGLLSFIWLVLRTGTKPSRIQYPCQKTAAANTIIFLVWLGSILSGHFLFKRLKKHFTWSRAVVLLIMILTATLGIKEYQVYRLNRVLAQQANQPIGTPKGTNPGRVVWVHDSKATTGTYTNYWTQVDQAAVNNMMDEAVKTLTSQTSVGGALSRIFPCGNSCTGKKVAIKINMNNIGRPLDTMDANFQTINAFIKEMTTPESGVFAPFNQADIYIYDASRNPGGRPAFVTGVKNLYPQVHIVGTANSNGAELEVFSSESFIYDANYCTPTRVQYLKVPQLIKDVDYLVNMPLLKGHGMSGGSTLGFKNFLGNVENITAYGPNWNLDGLHGCIISGGNTTGLVAVYTAGFHNPDNSLSSIDKKMVLTIGDGLYGNQNTNTDPPLNWRMFGNGAPNSFFVSQDPVAVDSVMFDTIMRETQNYQTVGQEHLEAAATRTVGSLGVHEHPNQTGKCANTGDLNCWQYSGGGKGIDFVNCDAQGTPDSRCVLGTSTSSTASLSLQSAKTTYNTTEEIPAQVMVSSDTDASNVFSAQVNFPTNLLDVVRIDNTGSFINLWTDSFFDNNTGKISLIGTVPSPGFQTNPGKPTLMATIYFKAKAAGTATITFDPQSQILRNSDNTNILSSTNNLSLTVNEVPTPTPTLTPTPTPTLTLTLTPTPTSLGATISLNPATTYQTMIGWEATDYDGADDHPTTYPLYRNALYDQLINDVGINRIRLEIRSGVENSRDYYTEYRNGQISYANWRCYRYSTVNDNSDSNTINPAGYQFSDFDKNINNIVIPMKQRLEAQGEKLHINLNYVAFTGQIVAAGCPAGLTYIHNQPAEYAEFVLATFQHMQQKYGFVPDTIEVILEPDNVSQWNNGTIIGNAINATIARLEAAGFTPRFVVPSTTSMASAPVYFDAIVVVLGAQRASQYITELSYHRYTGVNDGDLQAIANRSIQYGIGSSMLEWWDPNNTYQILQKDLTMGRNTAWQQGTVLGVLDVNETNPANPVITVPDQTKYDMLYYKFIRSGAQRIDAQSQNANFNPIAFINKNGTYVVVVNASAGGNFSVSNLPAGTYGIKYTISSTQYNISLPDQTITSGQNLATNIPGAGVITVYDKNYLTLVGNPTPSTTPLPCTLTSASWDTNTATESSNVKMNITANGNCQGKQVNFEVRRNIVLQPDQPAINLPTPNPVDLILGTNTATSSATWKTDTWTNACLLTTCNPEYFFKANIVGDTTTIESNPRLLTVTSTSGGTPTPTPVPGNPNDWPQVQKDPQHTGYSADTFNINYSRPAYDRFRVSWTYPFQPDRVHPIVQAIIYQGKVFVGTEGANGQQPSLYAIDATTGQANSGKVVWKFVVDGPILNSVAAFDNKVFVATLNGSVYAIDMNGNQVWQKTLDELGFSTAPIIADNKVMIGSHGGNFYGFDPNSGNTLWSYNTGAPIMMTAAFNKGIDGVGRAVFGGMDMYVYAINTADGSLSWKSSKIPGVSFKEYWPVITSGKVVITPLIKSINAGIRPGWPFGDLYPSSPASQWTWLNTYGPTIAAGNLTQVSDAMTVQDNVMLDYRNNPAKYAEKVMYLLDESTGLETAAAPNWDMQSLSGAQTPPCVDRDGNLVVPVNFIASGWGRLNLNYPSGPRIVDLLYDSNGYNGQPYSTTNSPAAGYGNADENLNPTCAGNMIFSMHVQEINANFTGAFDMNNRRWTQLPLSIVNRQMYHQLEGRSNPASISNGKIYHVVNHELTVREVNP